MKDSILAMASSMTQPPPSLTPRSETIEISPDQLAGSTISPLESRFAIPQPGAIYVTHGIELNHTIDEKRSTVYTTKKPMVSRGLGDTHSGFREIVNYLNLDAEALIGMSHRPWEA